MTDTTGNSSLLRRSEIWSTELKDTIEEDLMGWRWVKQLTDFPDGDQFTIPSIGDLTTDDYVEDTDIVMRPMDTGEYTFSIDQYVSSGTYITEKNRQDGYYMAEVEASFVPKQQRAVERHVEETTLAAGDNLHTANDQVTINTAHHRFSGGNSGRIEFADFAAAAYALDKANVPPQGRVAIVDPSVAYETNILTNIVGLSNDNMRWDSILEDGINSGLTFMKNIYGFDVYLSNYLPLITDSALPDRTGSNAVDYSSTNGKASYFFSAQQDLLPWVGAWRQPPKVDVEWVPKKQRHEFYTTARYGVKGRYRDENLVMVSHIPTISG